jgi:hypothetical protein
MGDPRGPGTVRATGCIGLVFLLLAAAAARAETCPAIAGGGAALAALPAETRVDFIRARLGAERPRARNWRRGFTIGYGALATGQAAALPSTSDAAGRASLGVGAASAALGVVALYAFPLTVIEDAPRISSLAAGPRERCAVLTEADAALVRGAASEARGSGATAHLANLGVNAALGLVLGLGHHRWNEATIVFGVGSLVGEAQIGTQPTGLISDLARYRAADLPGPSTRAGRPAWSVAPLAVRGGTGVTLSLEF